MRCLYLVAQDPISPNHYGGISALYYDQLLALSDLGHEIHLWHFASAEGRARFQEWVAREPATWQAVQSRCRTVHLSEYPGQEPLLNRALSRLRSWLPPGLPASRWSLRQELQQLIKTAAPQLIWAQHFLPAALALSQARVPVVYVHHDWLFRVKALRNHRPINPRHQSAEERLARRAAAIVSGSFIECQELAALGCRNVRYIPVSFEAVAPDHHGAQGETARLIHLGGMGTTANREGLLAFFERVWPALKALGMRLDVIGDTSAAPPALQQHLRTVNCAGHVGNLATVLRPYDIHLIPWEHATGQRTRLPLAFNHAQVVVATRAAVACYPEARDQVNCCLVEKLEDMAALLPDLMANGDLRRQLGRAAKATFEQCFTRSALLPRYHELLHALSCC